MQIKTCKNNLTVGMLGIILASTLLLSACSEERHISQLQAYIASLKEQAAKQKAQATQSLKPPVSVVYQADALRIPFENAQVIARKDKSANPLLIYPVNMLRFVGTIFKENKTFAFVITPDDKVLPVTVGDVIGEEKGKITQIYPGRIEVEVQSSSAGKLPTQHIVVLQLKG